MSDLLRDGKVDVAILAGPNLETWPSVGVQTLSRVCTQMDLLAAQFGGPALTVRGVIPSPSTGGLVMVEDIQRRVHRIQARSVVRFSPPSFLPDPFPGWYSQGLLPISTAEAILPRNQELWKPATVILGTGNRAFRFGCRLLDMGHSNITCLETYATWDAKRFSGWEVEKRNFEMKGGKVLEGQPLRLEQSTALVWKLAVQTLVGVQEIVVGRVVSAGPFRNQNGMKEYPAASRLFEVEQTAARTREEQVEGWDTEIARAEALGVKIVKALTTQLTPRNRESLEQLGRRSRTQVKRLTAHREQPFTPSFQGKWISSPDLKQIKTFDGTPKQGHQIRPMPAIECLEDITCNICQKVCPTSAITIGKLDREKNQILNEDLCKSCAICVEKCPSKVITLLRDFSGQSSDQVTLPYSGKKAWEVGDLAVILNRQGASLGSARVSALPARELEGDPQLVQLDVPEHLLWEARSLAEPKIEEAEPDPLYLASLASAAQISGKVEILLNGEKRVVREGISVSEALFEVGQGRAKDVLLCRDGSCGLCVVTIDGLKQLACKTQIHKGISVKVEKPAPSDVKDDVPLCACLSVSKDRVLERIHQGHFVSADAILAATHVGSGSCHGQLCMGAFKRMLQDQGLDVDSWIDWRFPWSEWKLPFT